MVISLGVAGDAFWGTAGKQLVIGWLVGRYQLSVSIVCVTNFTTNSHYIQSVLSKFVTANKYYAQL
jgi:hypothetical protein